MKAMWNGDTVNRHVEREGIWHEYRYINAFTANDASNFVKQKINELPGVTYVAIKDVKLVRKYGENKYGMKTYYVHYTKHKKY